MVVDRTGRFVSGRSHPRLVHVQVSTVPRAPGKDELLFEFRSSQVSDTLTLDPAKLLELPKTKVRYFLPLTQTLRKQRNCNASLCVVTPFCLATMH